ncbi:MULTISPECIES: CHC2 zinc finger domain-containing protein [unclassified Sphingomonas]|uniref:CHC2 zinc finger domain-containing protein n=1 Tax=unclassified Sphingomonas TaxID=196159 RepID=UPI00386E5A31
MSHLSDHRQLARAQSPLVQLVAQTVELETTQAGRRGSCPFHPDPTRGLYVYNGRFYCFSCGTGGDVIDWWMRLYGVDESTAAAHLTRGAPSDSTDEHSEKPC